MMSTLSPASIPGRIALVNALCGPQQAHVAYQQQHSDAADNCFSYLLLPFPTAPCTCVMHCSIRVPGSMACSGDRNRSNSLARRRAAIDISPRAVQRLSDKVGTDQ